ncbi:MAG TPA: PLDc N-terminal domain-containing protein [Dermatophilaceae bacterium]
MPRVVLELVVIGITIYAVIDAIQTEDARVQYLPKLIWIVLIVLTAPTGIGGIAWLVTGRQRGPRSGHRGSNYPAAPRGPDDDPDFLSTL